MFRHKLSISSLTSFIVMCLYISCLNQAHAVNLPELIKLALAHHPQIKSLELAEQSATKEKEVAHWQKYPTPSFQVESLAKTQQDVTLSGNDIATTLRLTQPLYFGGSIAAQISKSQANSLLAQAYLQEMRQQISFRVIQAYAEWLTAYLKAQSTQRSLDIHQKLLQQAQNRINEGISPASDLTLVEGRMEATSADLAAAQMQTYLALIKLTQLTSQSLDQSQLEKGITPARPLNNNLEDLIELAQQRSPNLIKAQAQRLVVQANLQEKQASLKPDIYLRLEQQHGNFQYHESTALTRLYIGVSSKLGAGLSNFSSIQAAQLSDSAAEQEYFYQLQQTQETVANDYALLQSVQQRQRSINVAFNAATNVINSFERQFSSGKKSWLDLMSAVRDATQIESQLSELKGSELLASWRLYLLCFEQALGDVQP